MRLLLIEDDTHIARELLLRWRDSDRLAQHASTLDAADAALAEGTFDIVLLDLGLPDGDGMDWLAAYRQRDPQGAVLVMTARDRVADRVKGLRLGADDYLVKPFAPEELDARIDVLVRRANIARTHAIRFGRLDLIQETSEVLLDGKRLEMSPREFELLFILMRAAPRLVAKRALVDALSERNLELNDAAAELYVSRLRKKLDGTGTAIRTLRGVGYQLAIAPSPGTGVRHAGMNAVRASPRPILYRQLSLRLMIPLVLIVAVVGGIGMVSVGSETATVFDRWLLDAAVSLADQVRSGSGEGANAVDLPEAARTMLAYDEVDHTWFSVQDGGRVLVGNPGIPMRGRNEAVYGDGRAFDAVYEGAQVRVAAVGAPCSGCAHVVVLVAETMLKRQRSNRVVEWLLFPLGLMLLVTCSAIYIAVRRTVGPLEALAAQWSRQAHASLQPIPEDDLPYELSPFASALNELLSRIRGILVRERMFAAAAAHQLRTPLTALRLGMTRARNSPDLASARAVLDELMQVTEHTGRLVQQLMLLGRLDPESRGDIDRSPVDLRDVARDVCGLFAEVALEQHVDLELQLPPTPVTVVAQSDLLVEALANLIDNGLKAAGRKGQVLVAVIESPASLRICDSGPGIKPSERKAIFERYVRGARPRWEGTGLGLSIVHDVATLHGATVSVADGELGGACFTFEFVPAASSKA